MSEPGPLPETLSLADVDRAAADIIAAHAAAGPAGLVCCREPGVCGLLAWARRVVPQGPAPPPSASAEGGTP
jgi:hypothetical protein